MNPPQRNKSLRSHFRSLWNEPSKERLPQRVPEIEPVFLAVPKVYEKQTSFQLSASGKSGKTSISSFSTVISESDVGMFDRVRRSSVQKRAWLKTDTFLFNNSILFLHNSYFIIGAVAKNFKKFINNFFGKSRNSVWRNSFSI